MQKREQAFTSKFNRWLLYKWELGSSLFEVKSAPSPDRSIPFSAIQPHQISTLLNAKKLIHKISDAGMTQNPCDVVLVQDGLGYLVFSYGGKEFYVVEVHDFISYRDNCNRKSLTKEEAKRISTIVGILQS